MASHCPVLDGSLLDPGHELDGADVLAVRGAVSWTRVPAALATAPAARTMAWSLAISLLGTGRAGRVLLFAGRALLVARLACAAIDYARGKARLA